jgi:hypothetical protein
MGNLSPLGDLLLKLQFQGQLFTSNFLQAAVAGPILGIDFLRKFKDNVFPEINQMQFACTAATPGRLLLAFSGLARPLFICNGFFCFQRPCPPLLCCLLRHRLLQ